MMNFSDALNLLFYDENDNNNVNQAYIEEIVAEMDFDMDGKIDANEFLESFRIVNMKKAENVHNKPKRKPNRW
ncbi:unnamed protein product [Rotaria sp. Silwood1]|nr:unnamed protein product [Rotaria sp. Silwood1]CAF3856233.1 unnamed protein product [Rotaria sp. Silwood1]CAF5144569.1 unnamed protein product [Rotaria sp. Silwood1]